MQSLLLFPTPGVIPVLINPLAVLAAVLPGIFMALVSLFKPKSIKAGIIMLWRMKFQVGAIALVGFGIHRGYRHFFPAHATETGEAEAALVDWPHFKGDIRRQGWIEDGSPDPVTGGVNWTFREGNQLFIASPAVIGNRIYIPSVSITAFGGLSGSIYCIDADTGAKVWSVTPPNYDGSFSSAVVQGDRLVVGEGLHDTHDARAICIDISDESNPRILWTHRTESHIEGTPTIDRGRVFFTAGDDGIYGVDLETGEELWHLPGDEFNDAETSILAHDGKVYIGLGFGLHGQAIVQVDGATGEVLHRVETPYPVFGPPSVHNGRLYVGMGNGDFVFPAEQRVNYVLDILRDQGVGQAELDARRATLGPGGAVWAFDIETMERVWEFETDRTVLSAVAIHDNGLYFASRSGGVYHLDFDGNRIAYWNAGEPVATSLSVTRDHVYLMTSNGMFFVLDAEDLSPVWDLRLSSGFMNFSSPAVARGQIYIGTENAGLMSIGEPDDAARVAVWSGDGGGPRTAGRADDAPLPAFGAFETHEPDTGGGDQGDILTSLTPLVVDNLFARAFDAPTPRIVVSEPEHAWTRDLPAPATAMAVHADTLAVTVGGDAPRLLLFSLQDGVERGGMDLTPGLPALLSSTGEGLLVRRQPNELALLDARGETLANLAAPDLHFPPLLGVNHLVSAGEQSLTVRDRPTGKTLWRLETDTPVSGAPALDGHRILLPTEAGLLSIDLATGQPTGDWAAPADPFSDSLAWDRNALAGVTAGGDLLLLDRTTGAEIARHSGAVPGRRPLLERGRVLWLGESAVHAVSRETPSVPPEIWVDFSWVGQPTTGLLAHRSKLFLGLTDWGLVTFGEEN